MTEFTFSLWLDHTTVTGPSFAECHKSIVILQRKYVLNTCGIICPQVINAAFAIVGSKEGDNPYRAKYSQVTS